MGKFKVGDRVRRVKPSMWPEQFGEVGKEYTVLDEYMSVIKGQPGAEADSFELVRAADWQPKVGERVVVIDNKNNAGQPMDEFYRIGETYTITGTGGFKDSWVLDDKGRFLWGKQIEPLPLPVAPVADAPAEKWVPKVGDRVVTPKGWASDAKAGDVGIVHRIAPHGVTVKIDGGDGFDWFYGHGEFKPFRIEAGRYYRTRDGRKVGPMSAHMGAWTADGGRRMYLSDGQRYFSCDRGPDDLVAPWQEPAAPPATRVNTAATVDFLADEYGSGVAAKAKPKFKVGDRVVYRNYPSFGSGDCYGTVSDVTEDGTKVWSDNWTIGSSSGYISCADLEPAPAPWTSITPTNPVAIVALIEDGQPKPATRPFVHATLDGAATEAKRLAGVHKGKSFGVYALTGEPARVTWPVYEREWQRLAAAGSIIPAIKELRAVSGIGLKAAKDAVEDWRDRNNWLAAA